MFAWAVSAEIGRQIGAELIQVFRAEGMAARWWCAPLGGPGAEVEDAG
jgi:hypothetical protein